jgi:hypothetical protein
MLHNIFIRKLYWKIKNFIVNFLSAWFKTRREQKHLFRVLGRWIASFARDKTLYLYYSRARAASVTYSLYENVRNRCGIDIFHVRRRTFEVCAWLIRPSIMGGKLRSRVLMHLLLWRDVVESAAVYAVAHVFFLPGD